ncbi:HD domain-containing protein [bacterium]|nr:HD domain-containing protein [bacterium]
MKWIKMDEEPVHQEYQVGDTIEDDILLKLSDSYLFCINSGTLIDEKLLEVLHTYEHLNTSSGKIEDIHLLQEKIEHVHNKTLFTLVKHFKSNPSKIFNLLCEVNAKLFKDFSASEEDEVDTSSVQALVESMVFLIQNDQYRLKNIMPIMRNDYTLSIHSFNVAMYALQLGYSLRLSYDELLKLGYASLLHDLGKKHIEEIIDHDRLLNEKEFKVVQKHVDFSTDILKKNKIYDPIILTVVAQHHERFDGSGYPKGLKKKDTNMLSTILAICDVFDSLTIERPYRGKVSSFEALKMMIADPFMKHQFNQHHIKKLLSLL